MRRSPAFLALLVVFAFACSDQPSPTEALALSPVFAHAPAAGFSYFFGEEPFGASAIAKNGDEIEISLNEGGPAPLTFHPKAISGGGSFTIHHAAGGMTTGMWTATKLISFKSFGSTQVNGDILFGGSLKLHIALSTGEKGILRLTCTDSGNPPPGAPQGMKLKVVGGQMFRSVWTDPQSGPTRSFTLELRHDPPTGRAGRSEIHQRSR